MSTNNPDGFDKLLNQLSPKPFIDKFEKLLQPKPRLNLDKPRYDQSYIWNRFRHFYLVTNPMLLLKTDEELDKAKDVVLRTKRGDPLPNMTDDEIWEQKVIYDSAFHPDTGEKQIIIGRMSSQVPMNTFLTATMMTFYRSNPAQIFLQWVNQSFNAITNYSNRNGASAVTSTQIGCAYVGATVAGVGCSVGLNALTKTLPNIFGRIIPFIAVVAANGVNIPIMRFGELVDGAAIITEDGKEIGLSKVAARQAIVQVISSRVAMACPTMIGIPFFMSSLEKRGVLKRLPWISLPLQTVLCGVILLGATPLGCALYPQTYPISPSLLEPELQEKIKKLPGPPTVVYYNKGL